MFEVIQSDLSRKPIRLTTMTVDHDGLLNLFDNGLWRNDVYRWLHRDDRILKLYADEQKTFLDIVVVRY